MSMQDHRILLNHLAAHRHASTLVLSYASLTQLGLEEIGRFLVDNPHIRTLDLRGNLIQGRGAMGLANGIRVNRSLKSLILKGNAIGKDSAGIASLCTALKCNFNITHVDFRNNNINNVGARHIGEMLINNTSITHIDISWNNFNFDGGLHILEGLKHNTTLVDCQLSGSKCGENTVHEVAAHLRRNRSIAAGKAVGAITTPNTDFQRVDNTLTPMSSQLTPVSPRALDFNLLSCSVPCLPLNTSSTLASTAASIYSPHNQTKARLRMKQQEVYHPDDHQFYDKVSDHIDKLAVEAELHKQSAAQTEARERNATVSFMEREHQLRREIDMHNDKIAATTSEKNHLQREALQKQTDLNTAREDHARAMQNHVAAQHQALEEEQDLHRQIRDLNTSRHSLQCELARHASELDNLRAENVRLRIHLRDSHSILTF